MKPPPFVGDDPGSSDPKALARSEIYHPLFPIPFSTRIRIFAGPWRGEPERQMRHSMLTRHQTRHQWTPALRGSDQQFELKALWDEVGPLFAGRYQNEGDLTVFKYPGRCECADQFFRTGEAMRRVNTPIL